MKTNHANILNRILVAVLALLGFSACGEKEESWAEYGCPNAKYRVRGSVTDESNTPIKGIRISVKYVWADNDMGKPVFTDENGEFDTEPLYVFPAPFNLIIEDVDGEDNGGKFKTKEVSSKDMSVKETEKGSGWYEGAYDYTADVKLEKE